MKVALVHDWLNNKVGGGERVLFQLAELFPDAPIYTLVFSAPKYAGLIDPSRVRTSSLQHLPKILHERSRYLLPLIPTAVEQFDFSAYDVVISSSAAWVKNIITKPETLHICYCHTPMRFVWDYWPKYLDEQRVGFIRRLAIRSMTSKLRLWDYYGAARVDHWIANSAATASRIKKYYHQTAEVIYPGVDLSLLHPAKEKEDYYICLGMLTPYKKFDLAIEAFAHSKRHLVVVGDGPDRRRLQQLATPNIKFTGSVSDTEKAKLLAAAKAFILPNEEDFGLVPVEAMAAGTPVIAYGRGGALETVTMKTGIFFYEPTAASLIQAIGEFEQKEFKLADLTARAQVFSKSNFQKSIKHRVEQTYHKHVEANQLF